MTEKFIALLKLNLNWNKLKRFIKTQLTTSQYLPYYLALLNPFSSILVPTIIHPVVRLHSSSTPSQLPIMRITNPPTT